MTFTNLKNITLCAGYFHSLVTACCVTSTKLLSQVLLPKIKLPSQVIDPTVHSGSRPHAPFRKYCDPKIASCLI